MRLPTVINYEDYRLGDGWEKHNDCVYEWGLELFVCADLFVLFQHISQPDMIECIVIYW